MKMFYLFFILTLVLQIVVANPRQIQGFTYLGSVPKSEDLSARASYYISDSEETWRDAYDICGYLAGQLVSPLNPIEDDILRSVMILFNSNRVIWTSARKTDIWRWESKETVMLWSDFHSPTCQSNMGCASAYTSGCKWAWCSENCSNKRSFVCEF